MRAGNEREHRECRVISLRKIQPSFGFESKSKVGVRCDALRKRKRLMNTLFSILAPNFLPGIDNAYLKKGI
jgi:hypothetical protein